MSLGPNGQSYKSILTQEIRGFIDNLRNALAGRYEAWTPVDTIYAASPSAWEITLLGEGNEADLDLIGAETSDHLWRHITKEAEGFPSPVIGTATLAVETGIRAWAGTVIVRK